MKVDAVLKNLLTLYHERKMAHAYLIETNNVNKCCNDLKKIIKAICCKEKYSDDCLKCNICHLIDENLLPSLIIIEPDGKNIKKEAIENLKHAFSQIPIYTENNIYLLKYPEKMNDTAFNKMLKFLEEPEENIIGFLITDNKDYVANTIVSRCEIIKMNYNNNSNYDNLGIDSTMYDNYYNLACEYKKRIDNNDIDLLWYNTSVLLKEIPTRLNIINFLKILLNIYLEELNNQVDGKNKIYFKVKIISKYLEQLNFNVNISLLLDSLAIEMRDSNGE